MLVQCSRLRVSDPRGDYDDDCGGACRLLLQMVDAMSCHLVELNHDALPLQQN